MSGNPRVGILLAQLRWNDLVEQTQLVERLGFSHVWLGDMYVHPFEESDWLDAWTALAGLAVVTDRVRLGTLVTSIVFRHPAVIAKQATTVDHISGARLELGIGAGGAPTDHEATGTRMWPGRERQQRLAEFVEVVALLLREERSSFSGAHYNAKDVFSQPRPVQQKLPLTVAAHGPRSMRVAARYADAWSLSDPGEDRTGDAAAVRVREMNDYVDAEAAAAGRDPGTILRSLCCGYAPGTVPESIDEALTMMRRYEQAGINEFVFTYSPDNEAIDLGVEGGGLMPQFLTSPELLEALAAEVL